MVAFKDRLNHFAIGLGMKAAPKSQRPDRVSAYITPRATRRAQRDINDWRTALQKAEHPDLPRRNLLQNIYQEVELDGHLNGQIAGRKSRAIGGGFSIYDKTGEANPELTALLDKPWFYELLEHFWNANLYGHSLVEVDGFEPLKGGKGGIQNVKLVNRKNVVPEQGMVLKNETDTTGILYRESEYWPWIFETSNTTDFGQLNIATAYILYKRYALASWSEFAEIYGIPPRVGKTDLRDQKLVRQMATELQEMGRSAVGVIDIKDEIEFLEIKGTQSSNIFKDLIAECNNEVSKIINGTVIGEASNGGSRSKEEVGERTAALISRDDRKALEQQVMHQVMPKLIMLGYPFDGCTWGLDDDINIDGLFDKVDKLLIHGDVDPEFIQDKFGIPFTPRAAADPADPKLASGFFQ